MVVMDRLAITPPKSARRIKSRREPFILPTCCSTDTVSMHRVRRERYPITEISSVGWGSENEPINF